jgi:hypothetical protein
LTDMPVQGKRRIRVLAWVALGLSVVATAIELWSSTPESAGLARAIFGYYWDTEIFLLAVIYIVPFVLDAVVAIAVKGWRNRVVALAGIIVLLVPVVMGIWIA